MKEIKKICITGVGTPSGSMMISRGDEPIEPTKINGIICYKHGKTVYNGEYVVYVEYY